MNTTQKPDLNMLYPTPLIRGNRISRMDEQELGRLKLTADTARKLGEENIGVFVGGCPSFDWIADRLEQLETAVDGGNWIVIPSTRRCAAALRQRQLASEDVWYVDSNYVPNIWTSNLTTFCLVESLADLSKALINQNVPVAGIIVLDTQCMVHKARGFNSGKFRVQNDRPQRIVDFRFSLSVGQWSPPLVFLSEKPAKSVSTQSMQRVYCLESFYFLDGRTTRFDPLPVSPHFQIVCDAVCV